MENSTFLNKQLQNDNVFVKSGLVSLADLTGTPVRRGLEKALVSEGEIVNIVSKSYGHLPNEKFFYKVEEKLIDANIQYATRSINRGNRSFAVDYILKDESFIINVKNSTDIIAPMLRFVNSYDGSAKTSGHFGFYRQVCSNGLHIAHSKIGFSVRHSGDVASIVLPEIASLVQKFMDNEFYSLSRKFEVMAETAITDIEKFVKLTSEQLKMFQYESSEKNPDPSKNARIVIETINREANLLGTQPNLWLGYNAFNELLHDKLKKSFESQKKLDSRLFEAVLQYN